MKSLSQLYKTLRRTSIGNLSKDVFERRTSTGSEVFSLLTCLDDIKFVFLSFFTVIEAIWRKICAKPPSKKATSGSRAPARKPYRITLLFTRKVCDFGGISVTERSSDALISKVEHHISDGFFATPAPLFGLVWTGIRNVAGVNK